MVLTLLLNASLTVRRVVAVGAAMAVCLMSFLAVALLFGSLASARANIDEKRSTLGRLQSIIALEKSVREAAGQSLDRNNVEFLPGDNEAASRGELQTRLSGMAAASGATVLSAGNAPTLEDRGVTYVGLKVNLAGSLENIHGFVLNLETTVPVLFIREVNLRMTQTGSDFGMDREPEISGDVLFYGALPPQGGPTKNEIRS